MNRRYGSIFWFLTKNLEPSCLGAHDAGMYEFKMQPHSVVAATTEGIESAGERTI